MKVMPVWAWTVLGLGLGLLLGAAWVADGTYAQSVMVQLGSAALLVAPIVLAEKAITEALRKRVDDDAAVRRTEDVARLHDMVRHFGLSLAAQPPTTPYDLGRMLASDGWEYRKDHDGHAIWVKLDQKIAVPVDIALVPRGVILGIIRDAKWSNDQYVALHKSVVGEANKFGENERGAF
ncbi:hypothetical protein [Amycolatopsis sp. BJA-103]|uniref:hypothetical protein n=1 Tax=Amycolatopsis sp. BJA-103 TaxID=1911175 RepID=UPI0011AEED2E|nr:hypothetical protein [Amycolatopsis sp. BJA-103]